MPFSKHIKKISDSRPYKSRKSYKYREGLRIILARKMDGDGTDELRAMSEFYFAGGAVEYAVRKRNKLFLQNEET